jgi:hypothetical protein
MRLLDCSLSSREHRIPPDPKTMAQVFRFCGDPPISNGAGAGTLSSTLALSG